MLFNRKRPKVFVVGFNKTGTSSLEKALRDLGFKIGNQRTGELLFDFWADRKFDKIITFAKSAQAFQDVPFSLPYTFIHLDLAFPGSKFILTVRSSEREWYDSLVRYHLSLWGKPGDTILSKDNLRNANYIYEGRPLHTNRLIFNTKDEVYNYDKLTDMYNFHNKMVRDYFKNRENDLLEINLSNKDSYRDLCKFLDVKPVYEVFPKLNATK